VVARALNRPLKTTLINKARVCGEAKQRLMKLSLCFAPVLSLWSSSRQAGTNHGANDRWPATTVSQQATATTPIALNLRPEIMYVCIGPSSARTLVVEEKKKFYIYGRD
jgi:hypothetical protein